MAPNGFTLNGVDYGDAAHGIIVEDFLVPRIGLMRVHMEPLAFGNGVASWGQFESHITFSLTCKIISDVDRAAVETLIELCATDIRAAHVAGPTTFTLDSIPLRSWQGRPRGSLDSTRLLLGESFDLEIICPDPAMTIIPP